MFARHLECFGLTLEQVEDRLRHWWSQTGRLDHQSLHDTRVLARFMPVEKGEERDSGIGLTIGNSFETFERAVRVIAADRPVYLWLDDVQWSPTSIRFAHWLVRQSDLPVVIVATVREDALEIDAREALDELLGHARSSHCEVGPLSSDQHRAFVRSMLPLDDAVADEIARRSAGNPLFAVQLLGQCVDREILVEGERGLEITAESRAVLPDDVRSVWLERVANAVADLDADRRGRVLEALELAAALGAELEDAQWRHACSLVGLSVDETVLQPLLDARLVERFESRWRFAHGTLREALEHRARDAGRWHRFCRACAESARWFGPRAFGEGERRRASYFLQAGDRGSALRPMLAAARRKLDVGRLADCAELRERHQTLCDELGLDANDSHRVENLILKARESLVGGDLDAAVAWGRIAVDRARDAATGALVSRALVLRGDIMRHRAFDEAVRAHDEALEIIEPTPPEPYIRALLHAAETRCFHPTYEQASKLAAEAIALAETHDLVRPLAHAHFVRAISIRQRGDFDRASREISVAHRTAERTGRTNLTARCEIEACLIHRLAGDPSTALRWGQRARNRLRAHGPSVRAMVELEVQLARLDSMTPVRAVSMLTSALRRLGAPATDVRCAEARFHLAAIAARSDDLQSARRYVEEGRPAVEVGAFDRAMAIAIDKAADAMMQGAAVGLAEKLWALAQTQWRQLGTTTVGLDDRSH
jgi:tetratricopeptide (TPR) repeat protein